MLDNIMNLRNMIPSGSVNIMIELGIALIIIIVGWIVAKIVSGILGKLIRKMTFVEVSFRRVGVNVDLPIIAQVVKTVVFLLIILLVFSAAFEQLQLTVASATLAVLVGAIPQYLGVALLAVFAWIVSRIAKHFSLEWLHNFNIDSKVGEGTSKSISQAVGGLVILFFLPSILAGLGLREISAPIEGLIGQVTGYIPHIISAALILGVGIFVARLVRQIVESVLIASKVDSVAEKIGLGHTSLSKLGGTLIYIVILVPLIISALDRLQIESISRPANDMLSTLMNALPGVIAAFILISVSYVIAQFITKLVKEFLQNAGFNTLLEKVNISLPDSMTLSDIVSKILFAVIMILALVEAGNMMNLTIFSEMLATFIAFGSSILGGFITIFVGLIIANFASKAMSINSPKAAQFVKIVIIILASAIGLEQMGIANNIITMAFTLGLGAIAVAFALAVGLGSKDVAAKHIEKLLNSMK
ncbi:mechanosensitive ion channel [Candidatus Gracilibacteria bacterium]|nr:mechanosensitive ion channel [Candidatus Gracilibacteria bacterium]